MSNKRFLHRQDEITIEIDEDGYLKITQEADTVETQIILISPLYIDEFLNQLKLTIAGE